MKLVDGYMEKLNEIANYSTIIIVTWVMFVIFCIIEVSAAVLSFYIFRQTKSKNLNSQVIYN